MFSIASKECLDGNIHFYNSLTIPLNSILDIHYYLNFRGSSFKEDEGTWKGNDDGKVVNNQPQRMMDDRNGIPQGGYIGRITNDAREDEMEENVGQVK